MAPQRPPAADRRAGPRAPATAPAGSLGRGRGPAAALLSLAFLAAACGDTLVDHNGGSFVSLCQGTVTSCGTGSACVDCTAGSIPANAVPLCSAEATCGYECNPGWLRCQAGCCRALSLATGWYHTCAILGQPGDASGQLRCWGANDQGQLGQDDLLFRDSPVPVDVAGLASGVTQVAAGAYTTCAIQNGRSYCWGMNDRGQVGAGTNLLKYDYAQPLVNVPSGGFTQLAPGGSHSCARSSGGEVFCWGANDRGQLGQGSTDNNPNNRPLRVQSLSGVASVAAGRYHSCALAGGAVSCWGADDFGQIGDAVSPPVVGRNVPTPTAIPSFGTVTAIAAGREFSLAIVAGAPDPQLWGWGTNAFSQLGLDPPPTAQPAPVAATIAVKPTAVTAGREHTCALRFDGVTGSLKCFGANDRYQLGDPAGNSVDVSFGATSPPPVQVSAGLEHTCAVLQDGSLWCWGSNDRGQGGIGVADPLHPIPGPALVTGR